MRCYDGFEVDGFFSICFERPRIELVNEPIKIILAQLLRYPKAKLKVLESATGFSKAKIKRYIRVMKKEDLLRYFGSFKNGHYEITDKGKTILNGKTKKNE